VNNILKGDRPTIDLVPLTQFSERIIAGWTMVPGYPLQPGDYCVTMQPPGFPVPRSNISRSAEHRNRVVAGKRRKARDEWEAMV